MPYPQLPKEVPEVPEVPASSRVVDVEAPARRPTILIVDDDPASVQAFGHIVAPLAELRFALSGAEGLRQVQAGGIDLVLLDAELPDTNGLVLCRQLKADPLWADLPVIVITSHVDLDHELGALEAGAVDFIAKPPRAAVLLARVRTHLRLKQLADALRHNATVDGLTGVANRHRFDELLASEWLRALRTGSWLSLLMVDVDHFKRYNDHAGHPAGDACLRAVARALGAAIQRPADHLARYGGEEFVLLLPDTPRIGARRMAERVLHAVAALGLPHPASPLGPVVSVSVGVSSLQPVKLLPQWQGSDVQAATQAARQAPTPAWLLCDADQALYAAKHAGRATYRVAPVRPAQAQPSRAAAG